MANAIRNMNFKPILEKITYERLSEPQPNANVNVQVWDEMEVKRLRSDAVKVCLQRNITFVSPDMLALKMNYTVQEIDKIYEVTVKYQPSIEQFAQLEKGVVVDDFLTSPSKISNKQKLDNGWYRFNITIHEGKNRQVRKMMQAVGLKVMALKRIKIGSLPLGNLPTGKYRKLTKQELDLLLKN